MQEHCQMCDNETNFLGALGNLNHFNCPRCGWHQHALNYINEEENDEKWD